MQKIHYFCVFFLILGSICLLKVKAMSRAQIKKTLTVMKNQCMSKIGVTEAKVGNIEQGEFIEERNVMCYVTCVYKSTQVIKNDRFNKEMVLKQIDIMYPQEMKAPAKKSVEKCLAVQDNYDDVCERVFYAAKCLYEDNPSNFIFP